MPFPALAHVEPNPIPKGLGPGEEYPCDARDRRRVGERVTGRGGGRIVGCAAPLAGQKGGAWVRDGGARISKARARDRRRDAARGALVASDPLLVAPYVVAWERGEVPPAPISKPRPHAPGRSRCDPQHPVWSGYDAAADAGALAPSHPRWGAWEETMAACVRQFKHAVGARRGAVESSTREAARARAAAGRAGVDFGSAEYLDTLRPGSRAKALRRMGRINEARDIERVMRAKRARR